MFWLIILAIIHVQHLNNVPFILEALDPIEQLKNNLNSQYINSGTRFLSVKRTKIKEVVFEDV